MSEHKKMILVFAGPNGSGKSTLKGMVGTIGEYINADDIKTATGYDDLTAAQLAEKRRNYCLDNNLDFSFETVLSTPRNLELLQKAKANEYFIKSYFIFTNSPFTNVARVQNRVKNGGHDVPLDKIVNRYHRTLAILPELIKVSDICNVIDNTRTPFRIFSKKNGTYRLWESDLWKQDDIIKLTKQADYTEKHLLQPTNKSIPIARETSQKPDFYYLEITSPEQMKQLENSGISYKMNKDKTVAAVSIIDKEKALECISKKQTAKLKK